MKRRANRAGHLYFRVDRARWVAEVVLEDGSKRTRTARTREAAERLLTGLLRDQEEGTSLQTGKMSVDQLFTKWLEEYVKTRKEPKTYRSYTQQVRTHIAPALGRIQLKRLTAEHVDRYVTKKLGDGLSPRTVQYQRQILSSALTRAVAWGYVQRNVVRLTEAPSVRRTKRPPLSKQDARKMLDATAGNRLEALFLILLVCGLRPAEAYGLTWSNVKLDDASDEMGPYFLITQRLVKGVDGKPEIRAGAKRDSSVRLLPLPPIVVEKLRAHRGLQILEQARLGEAYDNRDLVFCTPLGTPLSERNVVRSFKAVLTKAKLPDRTLYSLRRGCGTFLAVLGVHPRIAMAILGHANIEMTLEVYTDVLSPELRDAATRLGDLLSPQ